MSVEAYQIGVSFVADSTRVIGPIGEMLRNMEKITAAQSAVNYGFTQMVSGLGGARRLASSLANDLERAAAAARDIAKSSARFSEGGGQARRSQQTVDPGPSSRTQSASSAQPSVLRLLPPPDLRLTYDPGASLRTSTAGVAGNAILGGAGILVGASYGPAPTGRSAPLLLPPPERLPGTALTVIHGQGNSYANGTNFRESIRPTDYEPNFTYGAQATAGGAQYGPARPFGHQASQTAQRVVDATRPYASGIGSTIGPYAGAIALFGGAHGLHMAFRQGEETGDTATMMANAYGPNGRLWTDGQINKAKDLSLNAVRTVPGASYAGTLEMIARTSGITANADEALALAPGMARAGQIFAMRGNSNAVRQIEAAIQSGEIAGLNGPNGELDVQKLGTFVDRLSQTAFAMQGTFDLGKYLTGLRQFGTGASAADMNFLTARLPSIMRVMQESRAGTALSSLDQLMLSPAPNTRNARYAKEQERLGIRDSRGNVINQAELMRDPAQWYYDTLVPAFSKSGIHGQLDVAKELQLIFSRSTVQRLGASLSADAALYDREFSRNVAQQQQGNAPLMQYLQNAPGAQFAAFSESWRAFEAVTSAALMGPVVKAVQMMTGAMNDITAYVKAHPNDIKQFGDDVLAVVSVLAFVAKTIGTIYSHLPEAIRRPLISGIAGAAAGGVGGSVVPVIGTLAGAVGGGIGGAALGIIDGGIEAQRKRTADFDAQQARSRQREGAAMPSHGTPTSVIKLEVPLTLDRRELARALYQINLDDARRSNRAQSGAFDGLANAQMPGMSAGY